MCYATTVCSTRVVRVGLCVRSFDRGFLPMYESREVSTVSNIVKECFKSYNFYSPTEGERIRSNASLVRRSAFS